MKLARGIIGTAALLAPSAHREDFRREWLAELAWGQSSGRRSSALIHIFETNPLRKEPACSLCDLCDLCESHGLSLVVQPGRTNSAGPSVCSEPSASSAAYFCDNCMTTV